jgi:site-specific DNA recombinase
VRPRKKQTTSRTDAVIYCRVSTEEQAQNLSIPVQEQRAVAHCSYNDWKVVKVFSDAGASAKTTEREEFKKMIRYCSDPANGVGYVVVNDLSRFSRNANDLIATRARLYSAGVALRSVSESIDETSTGNFMTTIFGAVHQLDNERKSERTKAGMQAAADLGRWPHKAPIGYLNQRPSGDGPNVVPDPERSEFIQRAFEMAATGLHLKADILRAITNLGLRTAEGKPLPMQTFQKVLINPFYTGWMLFSDRDSLIRGSHAPLVSQELFDSVQDVLAGRRPNLTGYQLQREEFPLRRFVQCGICGKPLTGSVSKGRKNKYPYYRCRANCKAVSATPDDLHMKFLSWLQQMAPDAGSMDEIKETIRTVWQQRKGDAEELRSVLKRKLTQVELRKNALVDKYADGKVDDDTYAETAARYTSEIDSIRAELRGTELEHLELERVLEFADRIILRPARFWVESTLYQKVRLLKTLFPGGIEFDGKEFETVSTPLFFSLLEKDLNDDYGLASPTGFEPVLSP